MPDQVHHAWHLRAAEALALAGLAVLLPLLPAVLAVAAGDTSYFTNYGQTLRRSLHMLRTMARTRVVPRSLKRRWHHDTLAPGIEGSCTHCGNCCIQRSCVFLHFDATGRSACAIHGGALWRLTSCGRYPIDALDIAIYACPSYRIQIPIIPVGPARTQAQTSKSAQIR